MPGGRIAHFRGRRERFPSVAWHRTSDHQQLHIGEGRMIQAIAHAQHRWIGGCIEIERHRLHNSGSLHEAGVRCAVGRE
eukprot:PRCOL_00006397-RA